MMIFANFLLAGFLIFYFAEMIASAKSCDGTSSNVRKVNACPLNEEEWIKASDRKKCGNDNHACSSFIYHCVLNTWRNETLELCAPSINIVGHSCVEYNVGGKRIQRSKQNCSKCPVTYNSSESYKYRICYDLVKPSKQVHKSESPTLFMSTANPTKVTQGISVAIPDGVRIHNGPSETTGYPIVDTMNPRTSSEKQQLNSGEISAVVMCAVVGIILFTFLLIYFRKSKPSCIEQYRSSGRENSQENLLNTA
uniref:Uncharacterized protein LOC111101796 n=1 Tax=Crassostrea virginica TaxID=6565 RepID=A0A8B8AJA1_CRAVI|nr:uncharacterized protein LOC111101796 [Crassostrea virginica]